MLKSDMRLLNIIIVQILLRADLFSSRVKRFSTNTENCQIVKTAKGFPSGKEPACQCRRLGFNCLVGKIPDVGNGNPLQYSCLENPHGQRSLASYSLWGCKSRT